MCARSMLNKKPAPALNIIPALFSTPFSPDPGENRNTFKRQNKMSDRSLKIAGLSPEKMELLARRLRQTLRTNSSAFPLSQGQRRLWFLNQLEPGSTFYNITAAARVKGHLNFDAMVRSFDKIVERHHILRTTFSNQQGEPVQSVNPELAVRIPLLDLSELPVSEREHEAMMFAIQEARRPFDLSHGPLLRFSALRMAQDEHILLLIMHHIISDAWSIGVLLKEL